MGSHSKPTVYSSRTMAQFDVHRLGRDGGLVIDCQSELLSAFSTRLVVPLTPRDGIEPVARLNPIFTIHGEDYVMRTQFASTLERRALGEVVASLEERSFEIVGAIDMLISGI